MIIKRTITAVILSLSCLLSLSAGDRGFEPLTTWPYVYEEFRSGTVTNYQGTEIVYDKVNLCLVNGRVHYVKDGRIMEADDRSASALRIGDDSYVRISGRFVKVLRRTANGGVVALSSVVDEEEMSRKDIGYGKSALASTQNVSLTAISGDLPFSVNKAIDVVDKEKYGGEKLAVRETKGICLNGMFIPASRADVLKIPGLDKAAVKNFIKAEKIKFSDTDDLAKLADFLYSL